MFCNAFGDPDGSYIDKAGARYTVYAVESMDRVADPSPASWEQRDTVADYAAAKGLALTFATPPVKDTAHIEGLRQAYRDATHAFCQLAGRSVVDKLEASDVQAAITAAGQGPTALPLTQMTLLLFNLINDLRRIDGDDAWDRI